ncbi:MAG: class I mannose-6-phosphate isomerase [Clostridia bacterium]|nr:class I mannose-6-phosphate isomerase [Clostridia bacterium]
MYPLLLKPPVKDYIWGGSRLKTEYCLKTETEIAAEGWMLSCHKDGSGSVINGELAGKTLPEVLEIWGKAALGEKAAKFAYFPLLIKLIDAKQKLSVQVHPDDQYALKNEGEYGKTEMWYVVDCDQGAQLVYGFKKQISKQEFEKRIKDNTLLEVCNNVPVHKGDVFFINAGTLHAIGEGILIAEVQQNSNTTYRVSDYGRLGADGKPRPLHIEKAVDVTKCEIPKMPYGQVGKVTQNGKNRIRELAKCDFFTAELLSLKDAFAVNTNESFVSLVVLEGEAKLVWQEGELQIKKGDSIFIPAAFQVKLIGAAELLCSYV